MENESTYQDLISLLLLLGLDVGSVVGLIALIIQRVHPRAGWHGTLSVVWWFVVVVGCLAAAALVYKVVLSQANSGVDRLMNQVLLLTFGPMCVAGIVGFFLKP